ncbi:MAG: hypothetical protein OEZ54_12865, partial [Gemmatimonadota bacterium]|nr:hypothetical protein [Gemmatimonadota bacterium]
MTDGPEKLDTLGDSPGGLPAQSWGGRLGVGWSVACALLAVGLVFRFIDLTPNVESEFFFSKEDPQYRSSAELSERFPAPPQVIIRAAGDIRSAEYGEVVLRTTNTLESLEGIQSVMSVANKNESGPLYAAILLPTTGAGATNLILELDATYELEGVLEAIEETVAIHSQGPVEFQVSGTPYAVHRIKKNLMRDLLVFSVSAIILFGLVTGLVFRAAFAVAGAITVCVGAAATTLLANKLLGGDLGLLTANITTIVFVITLSHIVFLMANWRTVMFASGVSLDPVREAIRATLTPSALCMLTTFLG